MVEHIEKLRDKILELCKEKFDVFNYAEQSIENKNCMYWYDEDYAAFLSLAEKLQIKLIYYAEMNLIKEESEEEKLGRLEVGFFYNGIFHTLVLEADWFTDEEALNAQDVSKNSLTPELIKQISVSNLTNEMIQYIDTNYHEDAEENSLEIVQLNFWESKGVTDRFRLDEQTRIKMNSVESKVRNHYDSIKLQKEKETLPSLIDECVEWCKNEGLNKIIKSNLKLFLAQKEITLTSVSEAVLSGKVNNQLKRKD